MAHEKGSGMPYLSGILGTPVVDADGEKIGVVSDVGAAVREVFPRVTALAFKGPAKVPFMISWRKYVDSFTDDLITLNVRATEVRFSYLQPDELLLKRDLMNKQIVDTQGMKVVRVNDLKLSRTGDDQLRLLGAEVGVRGILRGIGRGLEKVVCAGAKALGQPIPERIISWSYMDLLDRDISQVKLSVTHKSLEDMHPADIADIIEQLDPRLRSQVFRQLDTASAAEAMSELDDEFQADVIDDLPEREAAGMIAQMDPDDAADIIGELSYEKAEKLLNLMGVKEEKAIRQLLGYPKNTAGGIMTSEFVALPETATIADVKDRIRALGKGYEPVHYVYTLSAEGSLAGVLSMRDVVLARDDEQLAGLAFTDLITISPEADQQEVAEEMTKYGLVGIPVVDADGKLLGIVTVDDALDVIEDEHERDLEMTSGTRSETVGAPGAGHLSWFLRRELWFGVWVFVTAIIQHVAPGELPVLLLAFLPIVLLVADDILPFAAGAIIDADEERPSLAGLIVRDALIGLAMGALGWLLGSAAIWTGSVPFGDNLPLVNSVLAAAMVTVALLVGSAAALTVIFARRAEQDKPTPGVLASLLIMVGASAVFVGLSVLIAALAGAL